MKQTGYLVLRTAMGVNMLFHAVNRFYYGINGFADWMATEFKPTFFPSALISGFAHLLPIAEAIVGISLLFGLRTKIGLVLGGIIISMLIAGSCMINKWDWVGLQMVYILCFYFLFEKYEGNTISIEN